MNRRTLSASDVELLGQAIGKALPQRSLSDEDLERLARTFAVVLQQSRSVSDSEHYDHHTWIKKKIEGEQWRSKFYRELFVHVSKYGTIAVLSVVGVAAYMVARRLLEPLLKFLKENFL